MEDVCLITDQYHGQQIGHSAVARRHSEIEGQEQFDAWMKKFELDDPQRFLVRLRNVIDVLVQDDWWFDAEQLRAKLPIH